MNAAITKKGTGEGKGFVAPQTVNALPTEKPKFDRNAYQREYMREYMRKLRAAKKDKK